VFIARRHRGDFVVLDVQEFRLTFDKLLRCSGTVQATWPGIQPDASALHRGSIVRATVARHHPLAIPESSVCSGEAGEEQDREAEGCTPFTSARSVSLLKADWNADFISCMANFLHQTTITLWMRLFTD